MFCAPVSRITAGWSRIVGEGVNLAQDAGTYRPVEAIKLFAGHWTPLQAVPLAQRSSVSG